MVLGASATIGVNVLFALHEIEKQRVKGGYLKLTTEQQSKMDFQEFSIGSRENLAQLCHVVDYEMTDFKQMIKDFQVNNFQFFTTSQGRGDPFCDYTNGRKYGYRHKTDCRSCT